VTILNVVPKFNFQPANTTSRSRGAICPSFALNIPPSPIRGRRECRDGNRAARHEGQGQGEDARHLRAARPAVIHPARSAPDGGTLAGDPGFDDAWIAKCLDHAASKKQEQIVPSVTGKVYNHSKRMKEKRAVLDGVAAELRRIIGKAAETELRLVA
jgi:hypothetical protein